MGDLAANILGQPLEQENPASAAGIPKAQTDLEHPEPQPSQPTAFEEPATKVAAQPTLAPAGSLSASILGDNTTERLQQSVTEAAPKGADDARKVLSLQMRTGLPPDLIERNLPDIEKAADQANFDATKFRQASPIVAQWMSEHPVNAAAAKDDVGPLSAIENVFRITGALLSGKIESPTAGIVRDARSALAGFLQTTGETLQGIPATSEAIEAKLEDTARSVSPRLGDLIDWVHYQADKHIPAAVSNTVGGGYAQQATEAVGAAITGLGNRVDIPDKQRSFVSDVSKMGGGLIPFLAAEVAAPGSGIPMMASSGAGAEVNKEAQPGTSTDDKNTAILLGGAVNGIFAKVGLQRIIDKVPPQIQNSVLRWMVDKGLTFGEQASINAGMQVANNAITASTTDKNQALTQGMVASASVGGTTGTLARIVLQALLGPHIQMAKTTADGLDTVADSSEKSKLREQSPQAFESLVARMKQDGVDSVYVPVEKWTQYFQSKNIDPEQMAKDVTGNKDAYSDAVATGGDVRIPAENFASRLAPTEHYDAMKGDMRVAPDTLTANEALEMQQRADEMRQDFETAAKEVQDWKPAGSVEKRAYNTIHDDISGQLRGKFEPGVSDQYAELFAKAFVNQSIRAGRDPMQDWHQYQVSVSHEMSVSDRAPDSAFNGDLEESLKRSFYNEEYDGKPVALANKGFTPEEIDALKNEGMADASGRMNREQFNKWMEERGNRLRGRSSILNQPPVPPGANPTVEFRGDHTQEAKDAVMQAFNDVGYDRDRALMHLDSISTRERLGSGVVSQALNALRNAHVRYPKTEYYQKQRGSIEFSAPDPDGKRSFNIKLSGKADLSTFLHETGHFWLERLSDLAASKDATVQIVDDFNSIKKWLGSESGKPISEEQHEQFARGIEAYLMEGKAPNTELQGAFSRIRAWLTGIYKSLSNLNVHLTDEVRGVMDRLIASDQEIKAAETANQYRPLFETAKEAGMTEPEFKKYQETQEAARHEAMQDLNSKVMRPYMREREKMYNQQRAAIREKVVAEVDKMREYQALDYLRKGDAKLDRDHTEARYGNLEIPKGIMGKDGMTADQAADLFGYSSGDEMMAKLSSAPSRAHLIESITDQRMRELHGDPLNDGSVPKDAQAAVHNEKRAEVMMRELKALRDRSIAEGKNPPGITSAQVIKSMAERVIGDKVVQDINPNMYRMAEAKAGRLAFEAAKDGRIDEAMVYKKQQIINHEMFRAAEKARDYIDKTVDYMQRFTTTAIRQKLGKAGEDYQAQIDNLLERYSFAKISGKELARRKSLAQFAAEQEAAGNETVIPDDVLDEANKQHYRELTLQQLQGVRDTAENIAHLANIQGRLLANAKMASMQEALDSIDKSIRDNNEMHPEKPNFAPSYFTKIKRSVASFIGAHTKMEFLFDRLDGFKPTGPVWKALFEPFVTAENAENVRMRSAAAELGKILDAYSRKERILWHYEKVYVPEVDNSFNKASLLAAALNTGNRYNKDALLKGYGWTDDQLKAVLSHLDKRDWDTVQAIWDHLDTYYPDVAALQKRVTGVAPKKVEADPVETAHGTYRGGYYPLKFDNRLSYRQMQLDEKNDAQTLYGQHWARAMTQQGHTKERSNSGGKPPLLSLTVLTDHIQNVIHDLTHREALIDATKLVDHPMTRDAIEGAAGKEMYRQLRPWLRNIAGDRMSLHDGTEEIMQKARAGATLVNMGFKVSTGVYQLSGILQSASRLGTKYTALGLKDMAAGVPWKQQREQLQFIFDRSEAMAHRMQNYDRDARAVLSKTSISGVVDDIQHSALMHVGLADMAVAAPTWLGAYRKAMDGAEPTITKGDEEAAIEYADSMVRMTQPSAGAKDLPQIMTGPSYKKIFTMFYSYWSTTANMMARETNMVGARGIKDMPRFAAAMSYLWIMQALIGDLMVGRGPDKDESWTQWAVTHVTEFPLDSLIGVRDIAHYAADYAEGKHFDFEFTPVADAFASIAQSAVAAGKLATGQSLKTQDEKALLMAPSYWLGLPGRQMWITGSYLHDWMTGKQRPAGVLEAVRGLAYGPKH